ncbi:DNA internalization-related competence protein ComEC/Rec2 [Shewanella sp. FJAT-52076]|uniref:DNA internalization-related competence protein ComEC/Rec2 n=1 Tax=Shewanella sp. FJAT-52076 TaxID=2864202 RepID=UPI001C661A21|nr:DNA internalization-related competence protein ComEC/Rec2 [Shewanella sp. FJAT-52076]QYJ76678.1 DNA internalization-related competence protein ComEC/Rec2 [Shewanella sp. FJAT-52076]
MKNPFLLGFCALVISSLLWPVLPPWPACLLLLVALGCYRKLPVLSGALTAVAWVAVYTHMLFDYSHLHQAGDSWVRGEIIAPVSDSGDWQSIDIRLVKPKLIWPVEGKIRLNWRTTEQTRPGEQWEFRLAPRSITSPLNEGAFNGQRYLLSRHVGIKARVLEARKVSAASGLRGLLLEHIGQAISDKPRQALLYPLLTGEQQGIDTQTWQQLRQTGTGHLMAISGLHMSVLGAWLLLLCRALLTSLAPRQDRRNLVIAMIVATLGCLLYGLLAGMGIPTRRAFIMLALVVLLTLSRRFASPWERLLYALAAVLFLDPLSPLSAGFWLSFGAIMIILMLLTRQSVHLEGVPGRLKHYLMSLVTLQLALSIGLGVLQLVLFGGVSVHSLWINLLMVPWFSLVTIPLALAGLVLFILLLPFGIVADWAFTPALMALIPLDGLLKLSDHLPGAWISVPVQLIAPLCFAITGATLLFLPLARGVKWVSASILVPLLLTLTVKGAPQWQVHLLDVGQGLAVVVFSRDKTLVYDTGLAFGETFSHGERTLVPFLRAKGRHHIDVLVISHEDKDHAGGAAALARSMPIDLLISDTRAARDIKAMEHAPCRPQAFALGSLWVEVLSPGDSPVGRVGNNASCVVALGDGHSRLLLPGDIEAEGEARLLGSGAALKARVLVAPHHGSLTSSTPAFIAGVAPAITLFAAGANNRYGFPKDAVLQRYLSQGSETFTVADTGQISLYLGDEITVKTYRGSLAPFWYNRVFGVGGRPITE